MSTRTQSLEAGARGETRAMLRLAWPLAASMLAIILVETTDVLMIARLGEQQLAAGALGFNLFILFLLFGVGASSAVSGLSAQALGAGDEAGVRRTFRQGVWLALLAAAPCVAALSQGEHILIALGQDAALSALAQTYLDYMAWVPVPIFLILVLRNTMAALECVRTPMVMTFALVPLNILFNWIFMFGGLGLVEPMGLPGAGLATLVIESMGLVVLIVYLARAKRFRRFEFLKNLHRPDWPRFKSLARVGGPAGGLAVLEHAMFLSAALLMGWIGTRELAAYHIAIQIASILFTAPFALAQAATIRIGQAAGAQDLAAVRARGRTVFGLTILIMGAAGIGLWLGAEELMRLFVGGAQENGAELIALGASYLMIAAIFQLVDGLQIVACGALRGLNDTVAAFWLGLVGYIAAGSGFAYLFAFPLGWGGAGVWWGLAVGLALVAALALTRFHLETRDEARAFRRLLKEGARA